MKQQKKRSSVALLLVLAASFSLPVRANELVQIKKVDQKYKITVGSDLFAEVDVDTYDKPIVYPIMGPGQISMTRNWPMQKDVAGEATDHPHHKSMWFAHGDINGHSFWDEKAFIVNESSSIDKSAAVPTVVLTNRLETRDGEVICKETSRISFLAADGLRMIDWDHTFHAGERSLKFGDTKEGMMAIRTHPKLRLSNGANAITSRGDTGKGVWGKAAAWIDYSSKIDDQSVGVTIMDHPLNHGHPSHWHARDYGLVAANPFGLSYFEGKPADGTYELAAGKDLRFRYRFVFHAGNADEAKVKSLYESYSKGN